MSNARFYHAGCSVCISAEQTLLNLLDPALKVGSSTLANNPSALAKPNWPGSSQSLRLFTTARCCT